VSVMLATDQVALYPAQGTDSHGWGLPGAEPTWCGPGSLQLGPGRSEPGPGTGGPWAPAAAESGQLYLPAEAQLADGCTAVVRGRVYTVSQVRLIPDPTSGGLDCQQAAVSEVVCHG
jgi:hypothetical protein